MDSIERHIPRAVLSKIASTSPRFLKAPLSMLTGCEKAGRVVIHVVIRASDRNGHLSIKNLECLDSSTCRRRCRCRRKDNAGQELQQLAKVGCQEAEKGKTKKLQVMGRALGEISFAVIFVFVLFTQIKRLEQHRNLYSCTVGGAGGKMWLRRTKNKKANLPRTHTYTHA